MFRFPKNRELLAFLLSAAPIVSFLPASANAQSSTEVYTYDALGRLIMVKVTGGSNSNQTRSYCFDKASNRTTYVLKTDGLFASCVTTGASSPAPAPTPTPAPSITVNNASAEEGGAIVFTVRLSSASSSSISVNYATAYGTAGSSDIYPTSGLLTFTANQISKTLSVSTKHDVFHEANESFTLNLSNATGGATIADSQGIGTIIDNDEFEEPTCGKFLC